MNETAKADPARAHSFEIKRPAGTAPLHLPPDWLVGKHAVQVGGEVVAWAKDKAVADALVAALAQQAGAEPVAFQVRRPNAWMNQWESCTEEFFRDTLRTGRYGGFLDGTTTVETRALFDHARQPAIPEDVPSALDRIAKELESLDIGPGSFAPGVASALRGRAITLRHVARHNREGK